MNGVPAVYLGRIVSKEHFRTFIYASDGSKKLVESWEEYEKHMESGLWFASKKDVTDRITIQKKKRNKKTDNASTQEIEEYFNEKVKNDYSLLKENE